MIELKDLLPWLALLSSFAAIVIPIVRDRGKDFETKLNGKADGQDVGVLRGKLDIVEDKVTRIEAELVHLPDKDTTHKLEMGLQQVKTEMATLTASLKPISAMAGRIQEALLEKVMEK